MATKRIICIGSFWHPQDWIGRAVYCDLSARSLPPEVELIDGGLQGINLLCYLEGADRLVFVDTLATAANESGRWQVIKNPQERIDGAGYGHGDGLAGLLKAALTLDQTLPETWLVGAKADIRSSLVEDMADCCLELAHGD